VCDTDGREITDHDKEQNPYFSTHIQKSISEQFVIDKHEGISGLMRAHHTTFEPAHQDEQIPEVLRYKEQAQGKPLNANLYWKNILQPNRGHADFDKVPFMKYLREIINY